MSLGPVGIPREYQGLKGLENTLRWTSPSQEQSRLPGVQSWDRPPVQYQRWLEPLWLASESTVQCNSELPGPRLYQLRAEETRQKSNPESQITGKQGNWKIWDSHPSPGTCKGFLCAVWIQFLGQLPLSRDISKGQQEANHELSVGLQRHPPVPAYPRGEGGSLAGQRGGMSAEGMQDKVTKGPRPKASTELALISVTYHWNCQQSLQRDTVHLGRSRRGCWAWSSGKRQAVERVESGSAHTRFREGLQVTFPWSETPADPAQHPPRPTT